MEGTRATQMQSFTLKATERYLTSWLPLVGLVELGK